MRNEPVEGMQKQRQLRDNVRERREGVQMLVSSPAVQSEVGNNGDQSASSGWTGIMMSSGAHDGAR